MANIELNPEENLHWSSYIISSKLKLLFPCFSTFQTLKNYVIIFPCTSSERFKLIEIKFKIQPINSKY